MPKTSIESAIKSGLGVSYTWEDCLGVLVGVHNDTFRDSWDLVHLLGSTTRSQPFLKSFIKCPYPIFKWVPPLLGKLHRFCMLYIYSFFKTEIDYDDDNDSKFV